MNVKDLIDELSKLPQEGELYFASQAEGSTRVEAHLQVLTRDEFVQLGKNGELESLGNENESFLFDRDEFVLFGFTYIFVGMKID